MKNEEFNFNDLLVDKENSTVQYNDELHKYWVKETNKACISVTTLINQFSVFDEDFWSSYKTLEKLTTPEQFKSIKPTLLDTKKFSDIYYESFGIEKEEFEGEKLELLKEWERKREESCVRGTKIHREHELMHLAGDTKELKTLGLNDYTFNTDITNTIKIGDRGIYPELLMSRVSEDGILRIAGQADLVIIDNFDVYIIDYKGLPLDTPILTTNGFKNLENLTKKDLIFDKDGNITKIKNISEIHNNPCYKITFDNGESIVADHEHRWLISFYRGKGKFKEKILTTEEIKESLNLYKENNNVYHLPKIINAKPINTNKVNLPIDPYILGFWLGDETSKDGSITTINSDFWNEVTKRGYKYGNDISSENRSEVRTIFGLRTELDKLNLLKNKHIPIKFLLSSYEQRLELLRGFMDANGYYNPKRKRFVMATTREYQADYLITLLATLGVKPSKIFAKKYCNGKEFNGWDVTFTMKDNPFLIRNQEGIEHPKTDKSSFRVVKKVELVETVPTKCLEVENKSHTFLCGYGLLPTHNTGKKIDQKSFFDVKRRKSSRMRYPLNNIDDSNFWHYTLQLSTYAWMIQKIDPRFQIKQLLLIHYDHDGGTHNYECEYLKKDVERMLAYHKKQNIHNEFKESRKKIVF